MPGYSAIEDVSKVLVEVLEAELQGLTVTESTIRVQLVSPGELKAKNVHVTVYLYRVVENSQLKNAAPEVSPLGRSTPPPLTLDLYYLLTAHPTSNDPETADTEEQHRVLGRVMQIFHDHTVFRNAQPGGADLRVTLNTQSTDEVVNLWNTFQETPYQPSVSYLVTPVVIEPTGYREVTRVAERQFEEYVRTDERPDATDGGD